MNGEEQAQLQQVYTADALRDAWPSLAHDDRVQAFKVLARTDADEFFLALSTRDQVELLFELAPEERRSWLRLLPLDDAADVIQEAPPEERDELLALLDAVSRKEVRALLAYAEDQAGGLMNPSFARVRPDMTVEEAISYLRKQVRDVSIVQYVYVLDDQQRLLGVLSFRRLFAAAPNARVRDIMTTDVVTVSEEQDQEAVSAQFAEHDLLAIPVVDASGRMKGVVTADDIVDVVQEEATEDIQKFGGMEALEAPYLDTAFARMVRKRAGWLCALFVGEMMTASAMAYFEEEIARAVVLALFIPLIISSGGNSGSQASTLVIRAMALGEVRLRDWWRVMRREFLAGMVLGTTLGLIGLLRILLWESLFHIYGDHYVLVAVSVAVSLVGVVMFGTLTGSLLPFLLRRLGADPASASAPFVATLVDVTGILIYFTVASLILSGTIL